MISVLIVDDEELTSEGLATQLPWNDHGFVVAGIAGSAWEALEKMEQSIPDLLILDIRMPEMDGIEMLKIVRRNYPGARVILISGHDEFEYAREAIAARAFAYILKPIDDDLLMEQALLARDEIIEERRQIEADSELRLRYDRWLPAIRNNLLCRLVGGTTDDADALRQEAKALEIDLSATAYRVVLIQSQESSQSPSSERGARTYRDYAVLDRAVELWERDGAPCPFDCGSHAGLLIVGPVDDEPIRETMNGLRAWANQMTGLTLTIGVGRQVRTVEQLRESFASANQAILARIVAGRNAVIVASDSLFSRTTHSATLEFEGRLNAMTGKALGAIQGNDPVALTVVVTDISQSLRRQLEHCIEAKNRLLHILVSFLIRLRVGLDLDVPTSRVFECVEVASMDEMEAALTAFLGATVDDWQEKQNLTNSHIVKRAVEHLHRNVRNDISLTRVAEALGVHPNYLSSIFRAELGKRFIDYEREIKIAEAKRLLKETSLRVYEVAASIQYQDVNHFTRIFKKLVGCSPREFRELA
ncbi:MAG: response regulator [Spirochaetota bacterium]